MITIIDIIKVVGNATLRSWLPYEVRVSQSILLVFLLVEAGVRVPCVEGGPDFGACFGFHEGEQGRFSFGVTADVAGEELSEDSDRFFFGIIL